jgi:putative ABC transport system permease protein
MLANLLQDIRYSLHGFARRPMFAVVVVLTLALGIGVNVAVFSLYDQIMLRELPVARPAELVNLVSPGPGPGRQLCGSQGSCDEVFSYPLFRDLEAAAAPYADLAASWIAQVAVRQGDRTVRGPAVLVSGGYFAALDVGPALGRVLGPQDIADAQPSAVMLSFDYWTTAFGADPTVLGNTLLVSGKPMEIVGVAPRGFVGTTPGERPNVFAPITLEWYQNYEAPTTIIENRQFSYLYVFGRLKPGVSREEAEQRLNATFRAIINDVEVPAAAPDPNFQSLEAFKARTLSLAPGARGQSQAPRFARGPLTVFFAATATILLIVCVNLANLMFARSAARIGEVAVRASLGAGRRRLYGLFSIEALLLASAAALLSLPIALGVLRAVDALEPPRLNVIESGLDLRAVAVAFVIAAFSTVVFSIAPIARLVGIDPARALQANGARAFGSKSLGRFRFALATAQIALSMLLLVVAALFAQSLANIGRVDLGLPTESIVTFGVAPSVNGYLPERGAQVFEAIEREFAAYPGVAGVSTSGVPLLDDSSWGGGITVEGFEPAQESDRHVSFNEVGVGFFATLGIPVLAGREFTEADGLGAPKVAIVNETFAKRFGLGANPIGKRVGLGPGAPLDVEIVGFVRDAAYNNVKAPFVAQLIVPHRQSRNFGVGATFYVRTAQSPEALLAAVPQLTARADANLPVTNARTFDSQVRRNVQQDRLLVTLAGTLASVATLLAALGIYGLLSYMVAQRAREIGLRLALGAQPARVRRLVLKQVAWMVVVGVPIGLAAALLVGDLAGSMLFELAPTDPRAIAVAAVVLAGAVFGASYWPARRASRVDPVVALRAE